MRQIYHKLEQLHAREVERLNEVDMSQKNKDLLTKWQTYLFSTGCSGQRVAKLVGQMRRILEHMKKDLDTWDKDILFEFGAWVNRRNDISDATKADYRRCVKQFYKWFEDEDTRDANLTKKFYKNVAELKRSYELRKIEHSKILTEQDVKVILDKGCSNVRDKAFIMLLHESGARIGELLNIRICDLNIQDDRINIQLDGKTGQRVIPIYMSVGYIMQWLDYHPLKDNLDSFLWVNIDRNRPNKPLQWIGARKLVRRCVVKSGITKQNNPHWFRHSRATLNSQFMTEAILCQFFGWAIGSKQVRAYVHPGLNQMQDVLAEARGIKKEEEKKQSAQRCTRCSLINDAHSKYCQRCGSALSMETAHKKDDYMKKAFDLFGKIMADPKLKEEFEMFQKT